MNTAEEWLHRMFDAVPGLAQVVAIEHGTSKTTNMTGSDPALLSAWAGKRDRPGHGLYWRVTTMSQQPPAGKRGGAADACALVCLWADLDYGTAGHKPQPGGLPLPPTADAAMALVDGLPEPTAWIHSGGGWYPIWQLAEPVLVTDENRHRVKALSEGWQHAIGRAAAARGWHYDVGVGDLARVLRLPGSTNWKTGEPRPCEWRYDAGVRYTVAELETALASVTTTTQGVTDTPGRSRSTASSSSPRTGPGPLDLIGEIADWLDVLPDGWTEVRASSGDVTRSFRRPGATSYDSAHVLAANPHVLVVHSEAAGMPTGAGQRLTKGRVYAYTWHNGDPSAAAKALLDGTSPGLGRLPPAVLDGLRPAGRDREQQSPPPEDRQGSEEEEVDPTKTRFTRMVGTIDPETGECSTINFWDTRPVLRHVHDFALNRMTSPWAVLAVVLIRTLATVPPWVVLPPVVGGDGSLNLFAALVAPSGGGKGTAERVAKAAVVHPDRIQTAPLGSGEGIAHLYAHKASKQEAEEGLGNADGMVMHATSVLFSAPEVDTLTALDERKGSTLLTQLRSAFSGEELGFSYAAYEKRIIIPEHGYRLGLVVGVQPKKAGGLLNEAQSAGGTPQRFIWAPAVDPAISADAPQVEMEPWRLGVTSRAWVNRAGGRLVLDIPAEVAQTIRQAHAAKGRGETDALDGHALFAREKVAVALALLDERTAMSLDDWQLAGHVMAVSDWTRAWCQAEIDRQAASSGTRRALRRAADQHVASETLAELEEAAVERVAELLRGKLTAEPIARGKLRKKLVSRDRQYFDAALEWLDGEAQVEKVGGCMTVRLVA